MNSLLPCVLGFVISTFPFSGFWATYVQSEGYILPFPKGASYKLNTSDIFDRKGVRKRGHELIECECSNPRSIVNGL